MLECWRELLEHLGPSPNKCRNPKYTLYDGSGIMIISSADCKQYLTLSIHPPAHEHPPLWIQFKDYFVLSTAKLINTSNNIFLNLLFVLRRLTGTKQNGQWFENPCRYSGIINPLSGCMLSIESDVNVTHMSPISSWLISASNRFHQEYKDPSEVSGMCWWSVPDKYAQLNFNLSGLGL